MNNLNANQCKVDITPRSHELFMEYAKDADKWGGTPLFEGMIDGSNEDYVNFSQLKEAGLITTERSGGYVWVILTDAGKAYAKENGTEIYN